MISGKGGAASNEGQLTRGSEMGGGVQRVMLLLKIDGSESEESIRVCGLVGSDQRWVSSVDELGMVRVLGDALAGAMRRTLGIGAQDIADELSEEYLTTVKSGIAGPVDIPGMELTWFVDDVGEKRLAEAKLAVNGWGEVWLPDGFAVLSCSRFANYMDDRVESGVEGAFKVLEEARSMGAGVRVATGGKGPPRGL